MTHLRFPIRSVLSRRLLPALALLAALAGAPTAAAIPSASTTLPPRPAAVQPRPAGAGAPLPAIKLPKAERRTRAVQVACVGMALALFIIIWRRT